MCKPSPPSSNGETITNGLSLEGVHVGTVNLMISSGTVILILFAVFFYFYCKGRRSFCGQPSTPVSPPAAPANGFQQSLPMPGFFPQYAPPPYTMAPNIQPSHAVTLPSAPSPEPLLASNQAELPALAPAPLTLQQLEACVDRLYSIANSTRDGSRASSVETGKAQQ